MAGPVKTVATNADRRTDLRLLAGAEFFQPASSIAATASGLRASATP